MPATPTPRGFLPPAIDAVPIPDFIATQTTAEVKKNKGMLRLEAGEDPRPTLPVKRPGRKRGKDVEVNAVAAIYAMGYRRGWTDSAAHYVLAEELAKVR